MTDRESALREAIRLRGVDTPCDRCKGLGTVHYSSGATWRGGIGTCAFVHDVCDLCWGSGDSSRPWLDLRAYESQERANRAFDCVEYLATKTGAWLSICRGGIEAVCRLLDDASKPTRRKVMPSGFDEACHILARTLRDGIAEHEKREAERKEER